MYCGTFTYEKKIKSLAQDSITIHQQENMMYESVMVWRCWLSMVSENTPFFFVFLFCFVWFFLVSRDLAPCKIILSNWQKKTQREKGRTVRKRKIEIFLKKSSMLRQIYCFVFCCFDFFELLQIFDSCY